MEALIISLALAIIHGFVKNPASAAGLENTLLALRDAITSLYPGK